MPQRAVTHLDIFQAFNECQSSLAENRKDYDYAETWMRISKVYEIHTPFVVVFPDILEYG